ncbi:MAG TPA: imidazole glycerol phosphate synthase subunit HisH [Flavobacteriales bacterium]|nr:imidazole glycerol phosphate synthase subunit HisH [Flavobacteriales bacterium]
MIAVIDYGMGNIASILNMFKRIEVRDVVLTNDPELIDKAKKIILPGVGAFDHGMQHLHASGIIPVLNKKALQDKIPVLGICLGMQLLTRKSEEGQEKGLGWIQADTKKFVLPENYGYKIPHMGWNYIRVVKPSPLVNEGRQKFYFVHSYYVACDNRSDIVATCSYGHDFDCVVQHDNIFGAQFHPEKSHKFGMKLLENFSKL